MKKTPEGAVTIKFSSKADFSEIYIFNSENNFVTKDEIIEVVVIVIIETNHYIQLWYKS